MCYWIYSCKHTREPLTMDTVMTLDFRKLDIGHVLAVLAFSIYPLFCLLKKQQ